MNEVALRDRLPLVTQFLQQRVGCPIVNLMRRRCLTVLAKISCAFPRSLQPCSRLSSSNAVADRWLAHHRMWFVGQNRGRSKVAASTKRLRIVKQKTNIALGNVNKDAKCADHA